MHEVYYIITEESLVCIGTNLGSENKRENCYTQTAYSKVAFNIVGHQKLKSIFHKHPNPIK
jgi:hypothetical protein